MRRPAGAMLMFLAAAACIEPRPAPSPSRCDAAKRILVVADDRGTALPGLRLLIGRGRCWGDPTTSGCELDVDERGPITLHAPARGQTVIGSEKVAQLPVTCDDEATVVLWPGGPVDGGVW